MSDINIQQLLQSTILIGNIHAERLQLAMDATRHLFPFDEPGIDGISVNDLAFLEMMTSRFAKLQDICGQKVFPFLLMALGEDIERKPFLDILHMMEKLGLVVSAEFWLDLRKTRNAIAHEYPDDPEKMVKDINRVFHDSQELLTYWNQLVALIRNKIPL